MRAAGILAATAAATATMFAVHDVRAVGTRTFELDSIEKLSGGDVQGVSVGSDGVVRAGWTLGNVPLPEGAGTTATCAVSLADGTVLVGTGPAGGGKVVRVAGDRATVFADTKESAVSALAVDRSGAVYAATTSGRIYRVSQDKAESVATLPDVDGVFALAADKSGTGLFAGTGSNGAIYRIEPGRAPTVYFKAGDPFVVSLAVGDDGALYAGTGSKGLLYRITGPGRATVLYDFPGQDVHAIAVGPNHTIYAVADEEPSGGPGDNNDAARGHATGGRSAPGPTAPPKPKPGKGSLWRFDAEGRPERLMHHDEFHYLSLAVDDRGRPYVGTGAEGRVYTVDDAHAVSLLADTNERQIGALLVRGAKWFALGSDPAVVHPVVGVGGADAVWTSKPLDTGLRARFGRLTWLAAGRVEVATRTGDTQAPDDTWSAWSAPIADGGPSPSPPGRYVQIRARLHDAAAALSDVTLAFATENLRAVVVEVTARSAGREAREGKEGLVPSGAEPPKHDSTVHLSWKVDNPDGDELRYRVRFRRDGDARWIDAVPRDEVLTKAELDWDTATLPEGKYRIQVDASDELANAPGETTHFALESAPVLVDNTPPVFKVLTAQGRRVHAEIVDGLGPIARVDVAIDGRPEWQPLRPVDGIFDSAAESVDADLTPLVAGAPGPHVAAVRAFDAAGNFVVRDVQLP